MDMVPGGDTDGIVGYSNEIKMAGIMHIKKSVLSAKFSNGSPANPVWHSGILKNESSYLTPRRF